MSRWTGTAWNPPTQPLRLQPEYNRREITLRISLEIWGLFVPVRNKMAISDFRQTSSCWKTEELSDSISSGSIGSFSSSRRGRSAIAESSNLGEFCTFHALWFPSLDYELGIIISASLGCDQFYARLNYQYERYPLKQPDKGLILGIIYTQSQLEASRKTRWEGNGGRR